MQKEIIRDRASKMHVPSNHTNGLGHRMTSRSEKITYAITTIYIILSQSQPPRISDQGSQQDRNKRNCTYRACIYASVAHSKLQLFSLMGREMGYIWLLQFAKCVWWVNQHTELIWSISEQQPWSRNVRTSVWSRTNVKLHDMNMPPRYSIHREID